MDIGLAKAITEVLGALGTVTESIEKSIESALRSAKKILDGIEKRRFRKIADSLSLFYFTPVGVRKDLEIYINDPSHDNMHFLENKLRENQDIIRKFEMLVYNDMDSKLFNLPMENIRYLFEQKSYLHYEIMDSRYSLEGLSASEKQKFIDEMNLSFEKFNQKLEKTIKKLCELVA
jgi:hypothetical protein